MIGSIHITQHIVNDQMEGRMEIIQKGNHTSKLYHRDQPNEGKDYHYRKSLTVGPTKQLGKYI